MDTVPVNPPPGNRGLWSEVRSGYPCPVCRRQKWCRLSPDGTRAACRFVQPGAYRTKTDRNGREFYLHRLGGEPVAAPLPVPSCGLPRAEGAVLHRVYTRLLDCLTLMAGHRRQLRERGMSDDFINRAGYRSLTGPGRGDLLRRLSADFPAETLMGVPGIWTDGERLRLAGSPGLLIPVRDVAGNVQALCIRPDEPGEGGKYRWLSSRPRGGPGPGAPPHVPVGTPAQAEVVRAVEGLLKADVTFALDPNIPCVGFGGADNFRPTLAVLQPMGCRAVRLAVDGDWRSNPDVRRGLDRAVADAHQARLEVLLELWDPTRGKGIDDALLARVPVEVRPVGEVLVMAVTPGPEPAPANSRPTILITTEQADVNDQAIAALVHEPDLYHRGGHLVRVIRDPGQSRRISRPEGAARIATVEEPTLQEMMSKAARWLKQDAGEQTAALPPAWSVKQVMRRGTWPCLRYLAGVVEVPTLRPDGTILDCSGYDPATGLLYQPAEEFPNLPAEITQKDARRAADVLLELVRDFPFVGPEHKAAWLAAVLTVLARPAINGPCPLFLFEASTAGSGKTLLAELVGLIATGRAPAVSELSHDNEEVRKTITSIAIEAEQLVLLDNASGSLGCPALDAALTATTWKGRVLGRSERTADMPLRTVWLATGNNLLLRGDTHRRIIPCRLEPTQERPEERSGFAIADLRGHVRAHRAALVVEVLTILRGHAAAGRPQATLPPFGSYEAWSMVVRQAVHWSTGQDPCAPRSAIIAESCGDVATLAAVLAGWSELPGGQVQGLPARRALHLLNHHPESYQNLREALAGWAKDGAALPDARSLGNRLRSNRSRVAGDWRLRSRDDTHSKVACWFVERVAGSAGSCGVSVPPFARESDEMKKIDGEKHTPQDPAHPAAHRPQPGEEGYTPFADDAA